jgi:hypothetical protein
VARGIAAGRVRVWGFGLGFEVRGFGVRRAPLPATLEVAERGREVGQAVRMGGRASFRVLAVGAAVVPGRGGVKVAVVKLGFWRDEGRRRR